ncbi:hypothetical protein HYH03_005661 [Edaphochlamys debaryana]|uniref:FAD-binding FR-type domain-containing protein n=1 Tax=Edaphochlamys debaryana TaxID=47281 RepID=A0A836C234_9CHLO|nr:hypothetical protein HYH03_005661 [Edaphochlamys debaryana]|eukprot:KAG2496437.1 hypothetical protein HYH03_005661 [Edaphochlamys debaryana]
MPGQHAQFFGTQNLMFIGARDASGQPWASALAGHPGFITALDSKLLALTGYRRLPGDPALLTKGSQVGGLGIEFATRRRNRVNGRVTAVSAPASADGADGDVNGSPPLLMSVDLSFGNCPKYIQVRDVKLDPSQLPPPPKQPFSPTTLLAAAAAAKGARPVSADSGGRVLRGSWAELGAAQAAIIAAADTFFIATGYNGRTKTGSGAGDEDGQDVFEAGVGCDVSHRGGPPGFVRMERSAAAPDRPLLRWADFAGNNMFQTLGNLATDPRCGLLFVDWASGASLQLAGTAVVDLADRSLPGAQRTVTFQVESFVYAERGLPLAVRDDGTAYAAAVRQYSPYLPTGAPPQLPAARVWTPRDGPAVTASAASAASAAAAGTADGCGGSGVLEVECVGVSWAAEGIKAFQFRLSATPAPTSAHAYTSGQYAIFEFPPSALSPPASTPGASALSWPSATSAATAAVNKGSTVTRTWTVTSHPAATAASGVFTLAIKRAGAVSSAMHDTLAPGTKLRLRGFDGDFTAAALLAAPLEVAVLAAGGIGITPLWAVVQALAAAAAGASTAVPKRVLLLYSVRHLPEAAFLGQLRELAAAAEAGAELNLQVLLTTTAPEPATAAPAVRRGLEVAAALAGRRGGVAEARGCRLSAELLAVALGPAGVAALANGGGAAMVCGPAGFMAATEAALVEGLGLPADRLYSESFNY